MGLTELLVACVFVRKAGQLWLVRVTVSGVLNFLECYNFSLRPGILNYCPGGGAAEYFQVSGGGFTLPLF
jgi:hypothetical protein